MINVSFYTLSHLSPVGTRKQLSSSLWSILSVRIYRLMCRGIVWTSTGGSASSVDKELVRYLKVLASDTTDAVREQGEKVSSTV